MANPVFGADTSPQTVAGVVRAENVELSFGGYAKGAVMQQMQIQFERSMNMLYEIGSNNVYFVGDRRRGTLNGTRMVAGSGSFADLINKFGNMCNASSNTLTLSATQAGCADNKGTVSYILEGVVLTSIGASVTAQDIVITESVGFMFVEMKYEAPGGGAGAAGGGVRQGRGSGAALPRAGGGLVI